MTTHAQARSASEIHPNAPPKLIKLLRKCGSFHKLADQIEVNVRWVHGLITKGSEPTDRTELGREIRKRLFLPRRKRKADLSQRDKSQSRPQSQIQKAIRAMVRETNCLAIRKAVKP